LIGHVINLNISSVNPRKKFKLVFHPCDWVYGGLTSDIKRIWNIPVMSEDCALYFQTNRPPLRNHDDNYFPKIRAEMHIWMSFLFSRGIKIPLQSYYDSNERLIELSEKYFSENLIFYDSKALGVASQKHKIRILDRYQMYSYQDWIKMAQFHGVIQQDYLANSRKISLKFSSLLLTTFYFSLTSFAILKKLLQRITKYF
jgi:hypothetical protein